MSREVVTYIVFGIVLAAALVFDLGLISKKNKDSYLKTGVGSNNILGGTCIWFFYFSMV
jgi:tellurite resistance protein TerC